MAEPSAYEDSAQIELLARDHDRPSFESPDASLTNWFRQNARQTHERGDSRVHVWVDDSAPTKVLGYFALAPTSIERSVVPGGQRGLARIPSILLTKLARSVDAPRGAGAFLLGEAANVAIRVSNDIGGRYLVVDAINEKVATWYEGFGFQRAIIPATAPTEPIRLIVSLDALREIFGNDLK